MNLPDLLDEHGVEYIADGHKHCTAGRVNMDCPYCGVLGDGGYRLGYHLTKGYFYCWRCGYHPLGETIHALTGLPKKIASDIKEGLGQEGRYETKIEILNTKLKEPLGIQGMGKIHKDYLRSRGIDPKKAARLWGMQGIGIAPRGMGWRIYIPIYHEGRKVSWTTRSISDDNPNRRYMSAGLEDEIINHKELLYGEDLVTGHSIGVVEGPLDVVKGGPGIAGTFGLGYTRAQLLKIAKYPKRVLCLDNEPQAQEVAKRMMNDLEVFEGETYNVVLDAKDLGSASEKELRAFRRMLR